MNVIIHSIREGGGEVGQIDISQISQDQYPIFAEALNRIAGAQLVPIIHPSEKGHFPSSINHRMYFTEQQEQQLSQLLEQYTPEKKNFSKTFFISRRADLQADLLITVNM